MGDVTNVVPRCLTREQAAAYVGVSVDLFDAEVKAGMWPKGRPRGAKGGKLTWDRKMLDVAEDQRSGLHLPPVVQDQVDPWELRLNGAKTVGTERRPKA